MTMKSDEAVALQEDQSQHEDGVAMATHSSHETVDLKEVVFSL